MMRNLYYSMYRVDNTFMPKKSSKELVTVKEAAELFGVSIQTMRRWDKQDKFKPIRHPINNYRLYKLVQIKKMMEKLKDE